MGFSRTKDRVFAAYETFAGWLARRPAPMRRAVYGVFGGAFWVAYLLPGSQVRAAMAGLARQAARPRSTTVLFRDYVRRFVTGTDLAERVRHGFGAELDGMLTIPERQRLDRLLSGGGIFLALPHLHASVAMSRGLSRDYPVLTVVSLTRDKDRAQAQRDLYGQIGCEVLDVRSEDPGAVARKILRALKQGKIVAGTVDRIQAAPGEPHDKARDVIRATAFGAPVGFGGWPTRFAARAGAPVVPAVVEQVDGGVRLILGREVRPSEDIVGATQDWVVELERLIRAYPQEWQFALDKHWSRVLRGA